MATPSLREERRPFHAEARQDPGPSPGSCQRMTLGSRSRNDPDTGGAGAQGPRVGQSHETEPTCANLDDGFEASNPNHRMAGLGRLGSSATRPHCPEAVTGGAAQESVASELLVVVPAVEMIGVPVEAVHPITSSARARKLPAAPDSAPGGPAVDDKPESRRLLNGKIRRLGAAQDLVHE